MRINSKPRRFGVAVVLSGSLAALTACSGAIGGSTGSTEGSKADSTGGVIELSIATAAVPQFDDVRALTPEFEKANPNIKIKYVNLPEDQLRDQLTQGVATKSSPFDAVAVGPLEVPLWARNGWLTDVTPYVDKDSDYDKADLIDTVVKGLELDNKLYAVPFSGESSMLMYRKDILQAKGITMPANPTWDQVADIAKKVQDKSQNLQGICLRGASSWGSSVAVLNTMINTFGGVWYDQQWKPEFSSPATKKALQFYVDLQRSAGGASPASNGFPECLTTFGQGNAAMWFDATSAGSSVEDPKVSKVAGKVGYAPAPVESFDSSGWLWSWNLAMTSTSKHQDATWTYMRWATSKEYVKLVQDKLGLVRTPAATRNSTYQGKYLSDIPFAKISLSSVKKADPKKHPQPTPYNGVLFLILPSYQDFGTQVSQQVTAAVAGRQSVDQTVAAADKILQGAAADNKAWADGK